MYVVVSAALAMNNVTLCSHVIRLCMHVVSLAVWVRLFLIYIFISFSCISLYSVSVYCNRYIVLHVHCGDEAPDRTVLVYSVHMHIVGLEYMIK